MTARHIESIIASQVQRWELAQRQRAAMAPEVVLPTPVITVSREFGARGAAVARGLAEQLSFQLWDKALVHAIAESSGVTDQLVASLDEQARGILAEFVASFKVGEQEAALDYAQSLGWVVGTLARHGAAVIVGRGAQYLVDRERALRVRIVESMDKRAPDYAKRHGVDREEAERTITRAENERLNFCRKHFGEDATDAKHYDLVINRDTLSRKATIAIIVAAYRTKFP
jgi:cytidylate kinase